MRSVFVGDPGWDDGARDRVYVEEIARQSRVFSDALGRAVALGLSADASDDAPWGYLQGALFASVVVCRLLNPSRRVHRTYEGMTRAESQSFSDDRGSPLRRLLDIDDDEPLLQRLVTVRDALEHFDERLDAVMATSPSSLCDRYISDGVALVTSDSPAQDGPAGQRP